MRASPTSQELESLAASQWGMFTTAQAQSLGIRRNQISRMIDAQRIESMCYGVYRFIAGSEPAHADIKAQWLSAFPREAAFERLSRRPFDAVAAAQTATVALGAGDFHASPYTFIVSKRKQTSRRDVRFLQCALAESDVVFCDGIPTTSFERTVYDLLRLNEDPSLVDSFMKDAASRVGYSFDANKMARLLAPLARRFGFKAGNGTAFAADLIARNCTSTQIDRASNALWNALSNIISSQQMYPATAKALKNLPHFDPDQLSEIAKTLENSPHFSSSEIPAIVKAI